MNTQKDLNLTYGIIFVLLSFLVAALLGVLAKAASSYTSTEVIVFFQNAFSLALILPIVAYQGWGKLKTKRLPLHLFRALTGTFAWFGFFLAIRMTSLTTAALLTYSSPLWVPIVGTLFFHEKVIHKAWLGIIIGFIGIALVLHPQGATFLHPGILLGLGAAVLMAFSLLTVRELKQTEDTFTILFYYFLLSSCLFAFFAYRHWEAPHLMGWIYMIAIGLSMTLSQLFLVIAYHFASAVKLGPFIYSIILFTALFDWMIWKNLPSTITFAGMALIITGGILSMLMSRGKTPS